MITSTGAWHFPLFPSSPTRIRTSAGVDEPAHSGPARQTFRTSRPEGALT